MKSIRNTEFRELVDDIEVHVRKHCVLEYKQHPLIKALDSLSSDEIKWVIQEYSQFSNESIHMLTDARVRVHEWKELCRAIDQNIEEEKGMETKGVPHLEIMRKGYEIAFKFDVNDYSACDTTKSFLLRLQKIFRTKSGLFNNQYLSGALLAFESLSIPEFYVLDALVNRYRHLNHITDNNAYLTSYIDGHKVFEVGHKDDLINAIEHYDFHYQAQQDEFSRGYTDICKNISQWWEDIYNLILAKRH